MQRHHSPRRSNAAKAAQDMSHMSAEFARDARIANEQIASDPFRQPIEIDGVRYVFDTGMHPEVHPVLGPNDEHLQNILGTLREFEKRGLYISRVADETSLTPGHIMFYRPENVDVCEMSELLGLVVRTFRVSGDFIKGFEVRLAAPDEITALVDQHLAEGQFPSLQA